MMSFAGSTLHISRDDGLDFDTGLQANARGSASAAAEARGEWARACAKQTAEDASKLAHAGDCPAPSATLGFGDFPIYIECCVVAACTPPTVKQRRSTQCS